MPENAYVKVVTRCAKHNHVFEIYSSYEAPNGELVFDLVPCPFCFSQKEMVEKPDSISILEEWTAHLKGVTSKTLYIETMIDFAYRHSNGEVGIVNQCEWALEELAAIKKAAEHSVHLTGGDSIGICEIHKMSFLKPKCPRCHPASR